MRRNRCKNNKLGLYFAAFGAGMIVAIIFPNKFVVALLAASVVILGLSMEK